MKTTLAKYCAFAMTVLAATAFTACDKEKDDSDTAIATDMYQAQKESDDIVMVLGTVAYDNNVARLDEIFVPSGMVTIDTVSTPKTMTVDFGTGLLCDWDNKTRKGKIIATWSGKYKEPSTTITVATEDYFVNGTRFDYQKSVVNNGVNAAGHRSYGVNISQCKVTYTDGSVFNMTSQRTREFAQGESTVNFLDDVYRITGTTSGTTRDGVSFTSTITSPLEVATGCQWIQSGTFEITPSGKATRTLDFGNSGCDANATVEINGTVYNINL